MRWDSCPELHVNWKSNLSCSLHRHRFLISFRSISFLSGFFLSFFFIFLIFSSDWETRVKIVGNAMWVAASWLKLSRVVNIRHLVSIFRSGFFHASVRWSNSRANARARVWVFVGVCVLLCVVRWLVTMLVISSLPLFHHYPHQTMDFFILCTGYTMSG